MSDTYLLVPWAQKDAAKALGARYDSARKKWFVPSGHEPAPFAKWLPSPVDIAAVGQQLVALEMDSEVAPVSKGMPLSQLLAGVTNAVSAAFRSGVWTTAEVMNAKIANGHYFLELSERSPDGRQVAKAEAVIWARNAPRVVAQFEHATGAKLDAGMKVMVRAKPTFTPQYGFKLEVDSIDPTYTLGDLEARKRDIRERLQKDGVFGRNRALPAPWDYTWLVVVAPEKGAGLGDFAKEAARLGKHGVLQVVYAHSRFQGESAATDIVAALRGALASWSHNAQPDALVIIRGGGAVNELAWLNDYELARFICDCDIPVLTGIGHERDSTVLDEVAHQKFDTPSKVITGIEQHVATRSREAKSSFEAIVTRAVRDADRLRAATERADGELKGLTISTVTKAQAEAERSMTACRLESARHLHDAKAGVAKGLSDIRSNALSQVATAKYAVPAMISDVRSNAFGAVAKARADTDERFLAILDRVAMDVDRMAHGVESVFDAVVERARQTVSTAAVTAESLVREIAGQGPDKTLVRGFAMVKSADGKTLTSAADIRLDEKIEVRFSDGAVGARVEQAARGAVEHKRS